ncbi:MAG TPA: methyltransferase [Spirochaetota bacterium]|nr:methyltransferase [Spirochaetota bacterium]
MSDKIRENFNKYSDKYDGNAIVQKEMANVLIQMILSEKERFDSIFEIGCGTGYFSSLIVDNLSYSNFFLNDISENMLSLTKTNLENSKNCFYLNGDFENYDLDSLNKEVISQVDLVAANAVFQWFSDLNKSFSKIRNMIKKEGYFIFSTFIENTFYELDASFKLTFQRLKKNYIKPTLDMKNEEEIFSFLKQNDFSIVKSRVENYKFYFDHPKTFLKNVKDIGANSNRGENIKVGVMRKMFENYINLFSNDEGKISASYRVLYCLCKVR